MIAGNSSPPTKLRADNPGRPSGRFLARSVSNASHYNYLFKLDGSQSSVGIDASLGAGQHVDATLLSAREDGWNQVSDTVALPAGVHTLALPASATGEATRAILVNVKGNPTTESAPYRIRLAAINMTPMALTSEILSRYQVANTENIVRLPVDQWVQAYSWLQVSATVTTPSGTALSGQPVDFTVSYGHNASSYKVAVASTNVLGQASAQVTLGPCSGTTTTQLVNVPAFGTPADQWSVTYQNLNWYVTLPNAIPGTGTSANSTYTHICSETYVKYIP